MTQVQWPETKYRLTQKAFIPRRPGADHEIIDPETDADPHVIWDGKPGPHMEPTDEAGEEAVARCGTQLLDPTRGLSLVVGEVDDIDHKIDEVKNMLVELTMQKANAENKPDQQPKRHAARTSFEQAPVYAPPKAPPLKGKR